VVFPLVRGRNIKAWNFDYQHVLLPHSPSYWKPIPEEVAVQEYKEMYSHVSNKENKKILLERDDYSPNKGPFYIYAQLFETRNSINIFSWKRTKSARKFWREGHPKQPQTLELAALKCSTSIAIWN